MLFATILLASQAATNRRAVPKDARGSMPAPCNSATLLNEYSDCHIGCGVHTLGGAVGSSCATNFCGSSGVCCRQGVTEGVCDGNVGCSTWHCCVCTASSTAGPTGAPAVQINGDPFTTYQGQRTQFFMPQAQVMPLIQCGNVELLGRAINSVVKGDDQQWFDMFQLRVNTEQVLSVEARRNLKNGPVTTAGESNDVDVLDSQNVAAVLERARLLKTMNTARSLTTLNVDIKGDNVNMTGDHKVDSANITVAQDISKSIGSGFVESVQLATADFGVKIQSSVAGKFSSDADRINNMHIDMQFTKISAQDCSGALPEIWGIKAMSKSTAKLLIPPTKK